MDSSIPLWPRMSRALGRPAATYPFLREQLVEIDEYRYKTIEKLFRNPGFRGKKLRIRTHAFVVLNSLEDGLSRAMSVDEKLSLLDERLAPLLD